MLVGFKFPHFGNILGDVKPYLHCICAEMGVYELMVKILTPMFDSVTMIL